VNNQLTSKEFTMSTLPQKNGGLRVLVIHPPHVPSYFNAGHHLIMFQIAAYLRTRPGIEFVQCVDGGALNLNWKEVGDLLYQERFDVAAVFNENESMESLKPFLRYVHELSPRTRTICFGRLSNYIPRFFERYGFDAIVENGDYEAAIASYLDWLSDPYGEVPGVRIRVNGEYRKPMTKGILLPPEQWVMADIREVPYADYLRMYLSDTNKFCGIPERSELVVPVARGCPLLCQYCDVPPREGLKDRRMPVDAAVRYIEESFAAAPFEYVSMYAPTFTLNRKWVISLCEALIARGSRYPWKCTTTVPHLDEELIKLMAKARCVRMSVGLETLDAAAQQSLPKVKRTASEMFHEVGRWCRENEIELNVFVILGLPGSSVEGMRRTVEEVRRAGARVRPTIYTPFFELREDMEEEQVMRFNRQLFVNNSDPVQAGEIYGLFFGEEKRITRVMERVPTASSRSTAQSV
jgi:anaerobic magnesium-protoporphyrin IX monomethyl ester cyclase